MSLDSLPTSLDSYRLLGRSGLRVSPLCLGCMTFGEKWGFGSDLAESKKVFDLFYEKGGNFFDTANVYTEGDSERFLGEYISGKRSSTVLATKYTFIPRGGVRKEGGNGTPLLGGNSRKALVENIDESLKRLGVGYIDLLYVHAWEYRTPVEEVMRALDDVVRSGKVLYVGISDTPAWVISQANTIAQFRGWSPFVGLQTRYNLLDRSFEWDLEPMARDLGLGTVPWGIVAEGFLTGKYKKGDDFKTNRTRVNAHAQNDKNWKILDAVREVAAEAKRTPSQVAVNWLLKKGVTSPLVGARTVDQLKENLGALDFSLTDEQFKKLNDASMPSETPFPHQLKQEKYVNDILTGGHTVSRPQQYSNYFAPN